MLRYPVASVVGAVLHLDSLKRGSMGAWTELHPAIPRLLQQIQGIGTLQDVDPAGSLSNLDAEVKTQQS